MKTRILYITFLLVVYFLFPSPFIQSAGADPVGDAENYFHQGNYAQAEAIYATFINETQTPENLSRWLYRLGKIQLLLGKTNEGVANLVRAAHESVTDWAVLSADNAAKVQAFHKNWTQAAALETRFACLAGDMMQTRPTSPFLGQALDRIARYSVNGGAAPDIKTAMISLHDRYPNTYMSRWIAYDLNGSLPATGGNLLVNPGFEFDAQYKVVPPMGWMVRVTQAAVGDDWDATLGKVTNIDMPHSGSFCVGKYTSYGAAHGWLFQTIAVTPGRKYDCTVYAKTPAEATDTVTGSVRMGVDLSGATDPVAATIQWSPFVSPRQDYEKIGFSGPQSVVATTNQLTFFLELKQEAIGPSNAMLFDDASVVELKP